MTDAMPRIVTPARWRWPGARLLARPGRAAGSAAADSAAPPVSDGVERPEVILPVEGEIGDSPGGFASGGRVCRHLNLHHDGDAGAVRCLGGPDRALSVTCGAFGGSYLSLVAEVPEALSGRFGPGRVLRLEMSVESSRPLAAFLRFHLGSADGHETFYETLVVHRGARHGAFDLDGVRLPFDARMRSWVDIIFARPERSEIAIPELRLRLVGKDRL